MSILSRDPNLSRKPQETEKTDPVLESTMVEKTGKSTPRTKGKPPIRGFTR